MKEKKTRPVYNPLFRAALLVMPLMLRKYQFHTDTVPAMNEPFLMLANHTTESDFLMGAVAAACPVDFVCGEHLLRSKNGKLIKKFIDPITIPKGASSLSAVKEIVKRLKSGRNLLAIG